MPQRWKAAGWICAAISAVLALVAVIQVFQADQGPVTILPVVGDTTRLSPGVLVGSELIGFLHAVMFGVLAGVAFFVSLACFLWSAVVEARQQRAEIVALLERQGSPGQSTEAGA